MTLRLPALSGLLLALCFPPFHTLVLPFFALAPLGVWVSRLPSGSDGMARAFRGGAVLGAVQMGLLFYWVPLALAAADPGVTGVLFAVGAYAVIVAGLAALTSVSVGLLHQGHRGLGAPLWLSLPVTWTALEWGRAHLPGSLALPWLGLGTSLTAFPEAVGMAELVGERGVTFWLAAVSGLVAEAWVRGRVHARGVVAAVVVLAAVPVAWGYWRAETLTTRVVAEVTVVQPNHDALAKVRDDASPELDTDALPEVSEGGGVGASDGYVLAPGASDLVVLPEFFYRGNPRSPDAAAALEALIDFSRDAGAPLLFGALGVGDGPLPFNSAFLLEPEGLSDFRYDKRRLVPVVERPPFALPGEGPADGYAVGEGWPLAEIDGVRYGVLVCYESSYPGEARALRGAGADVLVNITNDAWLGRSHPLLRTAALWQHPAHLVMRAVEGRIGVVRSANTGISLFVDPVGRVHGETGLFTRAVAQGRVRTTDGPTLYVRTGDIVGSASAAGALALLLLGLGTRLKRASSLDPEGPHV
ncbi:MAG: apolipoprotein N-acyltransferase [Longimicrobiales bacterium]|nr:apolipoprotein N-acyltransferase [Longimicrobiales bacterium]